MKFTQLVATTLVATLVVGLVPARAHAAAPGNRANDDGGAPTAVTATKAPDSTTPVVSIDFKTAAKRAVERTTVDRADQSAVAEPRAAGSSDGRRDEGAMQGGGGGAGMMIMMVVSLLISAGAAYYFIQQEKKTESNNSTSSSGSRP